LFIVLDVYTVIQSIATKIYIFGHFFLSSIYKNKAGSINPLDYVYKNAKELARLSSRGKTPSFVDGQIASIARINELILVTRNSADFKEFSGLTLENWHKT